MKKSLAVIIFVSIILVGGALAILNHPRVASLISPFAGGPLSKHFALPTALPTPIPSPSPSPSPLTFAQMNALYGPCVYVPTLMYHHVENLNSAKTEGHGNLTVGDDYFRKQMQYLKDRGYSVIKMQDLINIFDGGTAPPAKPVLLTFDDGYTDFFTTAFPILREFDFHATLFLPTGLVENPGYLTWSQVLEVSGTGLAYIANHTWSHHSVASSKDVIEKEISVADSQLKDRGLNQTKIFAYPYGLANSNAINFLNQLGYKLAFTTVHGSTLCKKMRLDLPRIRIGNANLNAYGL